MDDLICHEVAFEDGETAVVSLNNPVARYSQNPILTPADVNKIWTRPEHQVVTVHNAGIIECENQVLMLFRSHLRCGMSVLGIARSKNGLGNWQIQEQPALRPADQNDLFSSHVSRQDLIANESGGVEDPRIMHLDNTFAITYSAYSASEKNRVRVSLITSENFREFVRHGPMLDRDMRNVVIFPEKINGSYIGLFRPNDVREGDVGGIFTQIRIGYTDDWKNGTWQIEQDPVMRTGTGPSAFSDKIGPGAPPIKTPKGWLNIFHGVRTTMDGNPYVLGVALHDLHDPSQVRVSDIPILFPSASDCRVPSHSYIHVPNVVFSCGCIRKDDGTILIYYGGNDTVMNVGITHESVLTALCEKYGRHPLTNRRLYKI